MSITTIRYDLQTKLKAFADSRSLPVAWEGVEFSKPASGVWLQPFLLPAATLNYTLNCYRSTFVGTFQVNVWSRQGKGFKEAETVADELVASFPVMPKVGYVSIERTPSIDSKIYDNGGWVITPVTMRYRYESNNVYWSGTSYTDAWTTFTGAVNQRIDDVEDIAAQAQTDAANALLSITAAVDAAQDAVDAVNTLSARFTDWASYTPVVQVDGVASNAIFTHTANTAVLYDSVVACVEIRFSNKGTYSGELSITLPSTAGSPASVSLSNVTNINDIGFGGTAPFAARIDSGGNAIVLERLSTGGMRPATTDDITDTTTLVFTALYKQ